MALTDPVAFAVSSSLLAPAAAVWSHASTMSGVNAELSPLLRMTVPAGYRAEVPATGVAGGIEFNSWLLAGGVVPFDRHSLVMVSVEDRGQLGGGFVEESTTWLQQRWRHERDVEQVTSGSCRLTDRLVVRPRLGVARPVVATVVPLLFAHRHRWLRDHFGGAADRSGTFP